MLNVEEKMHILAWKVVVLFLKELGTQWLLTNCLVAKAKNLPIAPQKRTEEGSGKCTTH
jgi:hypothetical protein